MRRAEDRADRRLARCRRPGGLLLRWWALGRGALGAAGGLVGRALQRGAKDTTRNLRDAAFLAAGEGADAVEQLAVN